MSRLQGVIGLEIVCQHKTNTLIYHSPLFGTPTFLSVGCRDFSTTPPPSLNLTAALQAEHLL